MVSRINLGSVFREQCLDPRILAYKKTSQSPPLDFTFETNTFYAHLILRTGYSNLGQGPDPKGNKSFPLLLGSLRAHPNANLIICPTAF